MTNTTQGWDVEERDNILTPTLMSVVARHIWEAEHWMRRIISLSEKILSMLSFELGIKRTRRATLNLYVYH